MKSFFLLCLLSLFACAQSGVNGKVHWDYPYPVSTDPADTTTFEIRYLISPDSTIVPDPAQSALLSLMDAIPPGNNSYFIPFNLLVPKSNFVCFFIRTKKVGRWYSTSNYAKSRFIFPAEEPVNVAVGKVPK